MGSSLLLIQELVCYLFVGLFLHLFLSGFPLFLLVLLLLLHTFFFPYIQVFPLLSTHHIFLVSFDSGLWFYCRKFTYFFVSCLVRFFTVKTKGLPTIVCSSFLYRLCTVSAEFVVASAKPFGVSELLMGFYFYKLKVLHYKQV